MATTEEQARVTALYAEADRNNRTLTYSNMFGAEGSGYGLMGLMDVMCQLGDAPSKAGLTPIEYAAGLKGVSSYQLLSDLYDNIHGTSFDGLANTDKGKFIQNGLDRIAEAHGTTAGAYFNDGSQTGWGGPGTAEYAAQRNMGDAYGSMDAQFNQIGGGTAEFSLSGTPTLAGYTSAQMGTATGNFPIASNGVLPTGGDDMSAAQALDLFDTASKDDHAVGEFIANKQTTPQQNGPELQA